MQKKLYTGILVVAILALAGFLWDLYKPSEKVDFSTQIKPILNKNCIACHGGVKKNSDFSLLFKEDALADTKSGKPAIIPGNASGSELIRRINEDDPELRMPYEKPKLSGEEIDLLTRWINQGAEWGKHWAYTLPEEIEVPREKDEAGLWASADSEFLQNDIDHFILAGLSQQNLIPSSPAAKAVIARRVSFDITGLPPDHTMFQKWMNGEITYETIVDSLLALPAYGEKWASWWLDLARYADTKGYEKDLGRTLWRYRDWVIAALNKDMPYDQFTMEQLAGDMLPDPSVDQLIATAFHRNTMNNDEGGTEDEEFRVATVIDRVNTTFSVWQSTTMECVQCHSHPYDPFKHQDYYNLMAFFNNSRDEDTPGEEPNVRIYASEQQREVDKINLWVAKHGSGQQAREYQNFLNYMEPKYQGHLAEDFKNGELADTKWLALWDDGSCTLKNVVTKGASHMYMNYWSGLDGTQMTIRKDNGGGEVLARFNIDRTEGGIIRKIPFKKINEAVDLYFEANNDQIAKQETTSFIVWFAFLEDLPGETEPGFEGIEKSFLSILNSKTPTVPIMVENPDYMARTTQMFERGNWLLKADTVLPSTPDVLNPWQEDWSKDRLGFSKWITSKKNPLTARTLVNRVWHQIFGRGLVTSVEDIGTQSDPPTHPALLDWLALRFMNEHQWSIKALVRDIVLSGTYRQKSESSPESYRTDPENQWYARGPRSRLSAEQIRDQALAVSGLLSPKMYGPGVMPPQPENVWQSVYSNEHWVESKGEDKYRRAVYTYLKRTSPYPSFMTFDGTSREVCTVRRTVTNTPLQALVTLNDPVYQEAACHLGKLMEPMKVDKGISYGYRHATYSEITPEKQAALRSLYDVSLEEFRNSPEAAEQYLQNSKTPDPHLAAITVVASAIMNLDEFLSKG